MPEIHWMPLVGRLQFMYQYDIKPGTWFISAARGKGPERLYLAAYRVIIDVQAPSHVYSDPKLNWADGYHPVAVTVSY